MKKIFILLVVVSISNLVNGQKLPRAKSPESLGIASEGVLKFIEAIENSDIEPHSIMIVKDGKVAVEGWWKPYAPEIEHTMYSVSKSFTATAIGMLQDEGKLNVKDKVISFFPDKLPEVVSENLAMLTIHDLLIMSVGMAREPNRATIQKDWIKGVLSENFTYKPGTKFLYNSAATYVLSAIVQKVSGQKLIKYLEPRLLAPLGIVGADWEEDPSGINVGGWGLRVKSEDMAKFGQLFLQKGKWNAKQILSEAWIAEATKVQIIQNPDKIEDRNDWEQGYGYQMWRGSKGSYRADGAFGQYIVMLPETNTVVVITSEMNDMGKGLKMVWDHIVPALSTSPLRKSKSSKILTKKLKNLVLTPKLMKQSSPLEASISGTYDLNIKLMMPIESISISNTSDLCKVGLTFGAKTYDFSLGKKGWVENITDRKGPNLARMAANNQEGLAPFKTLGYCTWVADDELKLVLKYIEGPHSETMTCKFDGDKISMKYHTVMVDQKNLPVYEGLKKQSK
jgi:CubicO group peptidase (beta-lactamase class C family)